MAVDSALVICKSCIVHFRFQASLSGQQYHNATNVVAGHSTVIAGRTNIVAKSFSQSGMPVCP